MTRTDRQRLGTAGERLAARWYRRAGYEVVATNWSCAQGEIDLVCRRGPLLIVCEVKARRTDRYGSAAEAVTPSKRRRLRRLAVHWLRHEHPVGVEGVRFDVVTVTPAGVDVIESAF